MTVQTEITAYLGKLSVVARASNPATIKNTIAYLRAEIAGYQGMIKARAPLIQAAKSAGKSVDHLLRANAAAKSKIVKFQALLADQQKRLAAANEAAPTAPAPKAGRKPPGPAHAAPAPVKKPPGPANVVATVTNPLTAVEAKKVAQRGATVSGRKKDGSFHVSIVPSRLTGAGQKRLYDWHKGKKDADGKFPTLYVKVAGREKPHRVSSPSGLGDLLRNYCQKKTED